MKNRWYLIVPVMIISACFYRTPSFAIGLGVFGSFGYGQSSIEYEGSSLYGQDFIKNYELDSIRYGIGFIMDTMVAENSLFNYRLQISYMQGTIDFRYRREDQNTHVVTRDQYSYDIWDIGLYNSFGFGIVRTQTVRFWLGPQIGFNYSDDINGSLYGEFGIKIGPVLGVNINIGEYFTFFFDGGVRFHLSFAKEPWMHYGYEVFANVGIMFRIGDTYRI